MALPPFDLAHRVLPEHAKQDRIRLVLGRWHVAVVQRRTLFDTLADQRVGPEQRPLFNRPTGELFPTKLVVSGGGRGRGEGIGSPLFSGVLRARGARSATGPERLTLTLDATINPTRYVAHQRARRWAGVPVADWALDEPNLFRSRVPLRVPGEIVLDQEDNVLLSTAAQRFGRPEAWPLHLRRYWTAFCGQIDAAIRAAVATEGGVVEQMSPHLNLKEVETYWELASADPTALVAELEPLLFQLGREAEARTFDYPAGFLTTGRAHNAKSVRVRLRPGLWLKAYAKTTARVRLEVVHDLTEGRIGLPGGHTTQRMDTLYDWLDSLSRRAADDLNEALAAIGALSFEPLDIATVYGFVRQLTVACPDDTTADALLSLLVNNRVVRIGTRDPLREPATSLVRAGILTKARERYTLEPKYRRAAIELSVRRRVLRRQRSPRRPTP